MIKNTKLKKMLVNHVFPLFSSINKIIPKDEKKILIYCANDVLNDNSEAIFNYLINNGYSRKYEIICGVKRPGEYKHLFGMNIRFITKVRSVFIYLRSAHVLYSMGKIPIKPSKNQIVINMWHGTPLKKIGKMANIENGDEFFFTYLCAPSPHFVDIFSKSFGCPKDRVIICGAPKTDALFNKKRDTDLKKVFWAPTFRQSKYLGYNDSGNTDILPLVHRDNWEKLNDILCKHNVELTVKLHPLQDFDDFESHSFSKLRIFSDKEFRQAGKELYDSLAQSDALISDYSSVYLDYLVLNRPICFAIPDVEEYSNKRGFVFDNPLDYMPGVHANTIDDIFAFIEDVSKGVDTYSEERTRINDLVNYYKCGGNCKRVLEYANISL